MARDESDLLKKVFLAQKNNPTQGDFVISVEKDMQQFKITYEQVTSASLSKDQLKALLRKSAKNVAFKYLQEVQATHTKVRDIIYEKLEMQSYLRISDLSQEAIKTITSFRSQCTRGIKYNFKQNV